MAKAKAKATPRPNPSTPEKVPVMIPVETLASIPNRLFGAEAVARLLAEKADGDGVGDALELLAHELNRLALDLDVCSWPGGEKLAELRDVTREALA